MQYNFDNCFNYPTYNSSSNRLSEELPYKYKNFCKCLLSLLPEERIFTDKLRCLAPRTDASLLNGAKGCYKSS